MSRNLALIILDGWGHGEKRSNNAIHVANTPFFDYLWENFPHTLLHASEEYVGLPSGQIGGSEVGHSTIGAGKVIFQQLPRITQALEHKSQEESLETNNVYQKFLKEAKKYTPHILGLLSDGGVHSHINHLLLLLEDLQKNNCRAPKIHIITDGRDTPPQSAERFITSLLHKIDQLNYGSVATIHGRFYAMDRDNNIDRTKLSLDTIIKPQNKAKGLVAYINNEYKEGRSDEFIIPTALDNYNGIKEHEPMICYNFRSDRMRQITHSLKQGLPNNSIITFTQYHADNLLPYLFKKQKPIITLGEYLEKTNKTQLVAAESEKYPHVTYFFNGGIEITRKNELRYMSPSNKVKHDEIPEMKAVSISENVKNIVISKKPDFILVNFANPDMVGHTGNFQAVVKAVEHVDTTLKDLANFLKKNNYIVCITADHGNADYMFENDGTPHTAHTLAKVPFIVYSDDSSIVLKKTDTLGLSDIAGTVLELMGENIKSTHFTSLLK